MAESQMERFIRLLTMYLAEAKSKGVSGSVFDVLDAARGSGLKVESISFTGIGLGEDDGIEEGSCDGEDSGDS